MMRLAWAREVKIRATKVKGAMVTGVEITVMAMVMVMATAWGKQLGIHPLTAFLLGTATVMAGMAIRARMK